MKVGFNGLRGREISLISIVLMSATIIFWSWEKMPGLNTFLPPQTPPLQFSSGLLYIIVFLRNTFTNIIPCQCEKNINISFMKVKVFVLLMFLKH